MGFNHPTPAKVSKEELISLTIKFIMTVDAYATDKNKLVAKILTQQTKESSTNLPRPSIGKEE